MPKRFVLMSSLALAALLLPLGAMAQDDALSGPLMGFVFDSSAGGFRSIKGMPGAATVSDPAAVPYSVVKAQIAPSQAFAVAVIGDEATPSVIRLAGDFGTAAAIASAGADPAEIYLSPTGSSALLHYAGQKLQVVSGLPDSPAVSREIDISGYAAETAVFAVSDDASLVLMGFSSGGAGSVMLAAGDGAPQFVLNAARPAGIGFLANSDAAIVTDADTSSAYMLRSLSSGLEVQLVAGQQDGLAAPAGVSVSGDNREAVIVNANQSTVVRVDLGGGPATVLDCSCQPTGVQRLGGRSIFRLTDISSDPMWLVDGESASPRVVFVPPPQAEPQGIQPRIPDTGAEL